MSVFAQRGVSCWQLVVGSCLALLMVAHNAWAEPVPLSQFHTAPPGNPPAPWKLFTHPDGKPATSFSIAPSPASAGSATAEPALQIQANNSYATLLHPVKIEYSGDAQVLLQWWWHVDQFPTGADLKTKTGDDAAVRVCVFFDAPTTYLGLAERTKLAIARSRLSSQAVPNATLCYVWDNSLPAGTVLSNAFTDSVRIVVLQQGLSTKQAFWTREKVDVFADFKRVFQWQQDPIPPISAIAIGADADNTHSSARAWLSHVQLSRNIKAASAISSSAPTPIPSAETAR